MTDARRKRASVARRQRRLREARIETTAVNAVLTGPGRLPPL